MNQTEKRQAVAYIKAEIASKLDRATAVANNERVAWFAQKPPAKVAAAFEAIKKNLEIIDKADWAFDFDQYRGQACPPQDKARIQPCPTSAEAQRLVARTSTYDRKTTHEFTDQQRDLEAGVWSGRFTTYAEVVDAAKAVDPKITDPSRE